MSKFKPKGILEKLVLKRDNREIIIKIMEGERLSRSDIFAEDAAFQLNLETAMMLAHIGLPESMHDDAIDIVRQKCGEDSEMFEFLFVEYKQSDKGNEPEEGEARLLKAIRENDELVVVALIDHGDCRITEDFPDEYIPFLGALSSNVRPKLFFYGFYARPLVLLLHKLISPESKDITIPPEVKQLNYDTRRALINEIMPVLMRDVIDVEDDDDDKQYHDDENVENEYHDDDEADDDKTPCENAVELICGYLDQKKIKYELDDNKHDIQFIVPIDAPFKKYYSGICVRERFILMYAILPFQCPEDRRQAVAEYLNRINYELVFGNFEMDQSSGEIRLRHNYMTKGFVFNAEEAYPAILAFPTMLLKKYVPWLASVITGRLTPEEAFNQAVSYENKSK